MKRLLATLSLLAICQSAFSDDDAAKILNASTGNWSGELYYLDYQSGQRFGIPMQIQAERTPDGATLIRRLTFTDPGQLVHAISLSTIDRDTGELVESYFREGKGEHLRYTVTEKTINAKDDWRIVYEHEAMDDNRPAMIRHTLSRQGRKMSSTKEVRFLDGEADYFLRNGTELTLKN